MRLLQLVTAPGELLDLHPHVTVVTGLDEHAHLVLVNAVAGLASAEAAPGGGLLEAHGVLFDLDPAPLGILELATGDLDPIVRPGHLPGHPISVDARELRSREQAFAVLLERISERVADQSEARGAAHAAEEALAAARRARAEAESAAVEVTESLDRLSGRLGDLEARRRDVEDQLSSARVRLAEAQEARRAVEARTADARSASASATARREALEVELQVLDDAIDPACADGVEEAAADLHRIEAEVAAERAEEAERAASAQGAVEEAVAPETEEPPDVTLQRMEVRLAELEQLLLVLTPVEQQVVEEALSLLRGSEGVELVESRDAHDLAAALDAVAAELASAPSGPGEVDAGAVSAARTRLEDAQIALLEAERGARSPEVDRAEAARLEEVHEALLEALDNAERRFGGTRFGQRAAELRVQEQQILDHLGFASYAAYIMGHSSREVDPAQGIALDAARTELAAAEEGWQQISAATDAALARAAVLDRRRSLLADARRLLGREPGPAPQEDLRSLRVPAVSGEAAATHLRSALAGVGMDLGDEELDEDELVLVAEAWLGEADLVDDRRHRAAEERAAILDELPALRAAVAAERGSPSPVAIESLDDPEERWSARVEAARTRLEEAEDRWLRSELAVERRGALAEEVAAAQQLERAVIDETADAEREVASARELEDGTARAVEELSGELVDIDRQRAEVTKLLTEASAAPDLDDLDAAIEAAQRRHDEALHAVDAVDRAVEQLDADGQAAALEIERLQDLVVAQGNGGATPAEELEWYLLARLAAQRAVSVAGSLPLLLDDALRGLDGADVDRILARLEPMAEAVQVIIVSEDPVVAAWARTAGPTRAAVVAPTPI